ncbi:hypothetical protein [Azospirillum doebereinerae]
MIAMPTAVRSPMIPVLRLRSPPGGAFPPDPEYEMRTRSFQEQKQNL